jgi:hypothetical protein
MRNSILWVALGSLMLLGACNNQKEQEAKLAEEVTAIHDEVMPSMDEIMRLKADIKTKIEKDSSQKPLADSLSLELTKADDGMMDWMQSYNPSYHNEGHSHEEVIKYYEAERQKISQVKEQTKKSIEAAKAFVK